MNIIKNTLNLQGVAMVSRLPVMSRIPVNYVNPLFLSLQMNTLQMFPVPQ